MEAASKPGKPLDPASSPKPPKPPKPASKPGKPPLLPPKPPASKPGKPPLLVPPLLLLLAPASAGLLDVPDDPDVAGFAPDEPLLLDEEDDEGTVVVVSVVVAGASADSPSLPATLLHAVARTTQPKIAIARPM